jgi:hypothetical protein
VSYRPARRDDSCTPDDGPLLAGIGATILSNSAYGAAPSSLIIEVHTAQSNLKWMQKRPEMMKHSLLPINQMLCDKQTWDETEILARGQQLFDKALTIWTR